MRFLRFFFILFLASVCSAETTKTIYNPFTQKLDYITKIDSNTIQPGSNITVTSLSTGAVIVSASASAGGPATLPLPGGDTSYIQNTAALQSGATAYPDFLITSLGTFGGQGRGSYEAIFSTTTTFYHVAVSTNGHLNCKGTPPVLSSCGTNPSIVGSDTSFTITVGGSATGCIATFNVPFNSAPTCTVSERSMSVINALSYTLTNVALSVAQTGLSNGILDVVCMGRD